MSRNGLQYCRKRCAIGCGAFCVCRYCDLRRLSPRDRRPGRPALSISVHQLYELRSALHDHPSDAVRPAVDYDGYLSDVRGLPARIRRSCQPAVSRPTQRLPDVRAAVPVGGQAGNCVAFVKRPECFRSNTEVAEVGKDSGHQGAGRVSSGL